MVSDDFDMESGHTSGLRWSMIRVPKEGETECGDTYLIKNFPDKAFLAAIDGLGHGKKAAFASERAKYLLDSNDEGSLINIVDHCHSGLRDTRGVVMSLALVDSGERTLTWMGVGNVQGFLLSPNGAKPESIILKHGIVGYRLPSLKAAMLQISMGDILIFTTDGVQNEYIGELDTSRSPKEIAGFIASNYIERSDDALILVARFTGEKEDVQTE